LLFPSAYHPFSGSGLEALAAGLPVVTSRANGFAEIITPGVEGEILPDPSDPEAIARAIEAWSDPGKRRAIRPLLLDLAMKFNLESNLTATLALVDHFVLT
jgi:UDP-glucose:(heptosyl)LPS alpha-1,3-glucosyltransferase